MLGLVAACSLPMVTRMTEPDAFSTLIKPNLPIFALVAGLYVALFIYRRFRPDFRGSLGEKLVTRGTFRELDAKTYRGFSDLHLPRPKGEGMTQVDHVVVSPFGIFVIETKDYTGAIHGAEEQAQWTQTFSSGGKFSFPNPVWQNRLHIAALAQLLKLPESKFHSVIYFMGGCMFKTALPGYVINDELTEHITKFEEVMLTPEEVEKANEALAEVVAKGRKAA